eukprot:scaffold27891_cov43-Phaeocystis_antarctica.AAC.2
MAGAARGGEAGAPAGEAQQARASVAWPSRRALNLHTERPCTPPYPQRATARRARYPCQHTRTHTHRRVRMRAARSAGGLARHRTAS